MKTRGLTLVELLVVMAIAAVLATLAAPSFKRQVQNARISSAVDTFLSDLRFARNEAMRRSTTVTVCRSDAPEAKSPSCATGAQGKGGWTSGWIVRVGNGDNVRDAGLILRVQGRFNSVDAIVEDKTATTAISFTPTGRLLNLHSAASLRFGGSEYSPDVQRRVCINVGGRARIAPSADRCGG